MASTNKTPNYNLSQFIATDKPAWLTDVNGDMSKIDTAIKAVSDRVSVNETAITEAEANIEDNATSISALQASSAQHGTDITDLKAQDIIINNNISQLQNRDADYIVNTYTDSGWTVVKYNSGRVDCYGEFEETFEFSSSQWGTIYYKNLTNVAFPTGLFISTPIVHANVSSDMDSFFGLGASNTISASNAGVLVIMRPTPASAGSHVAIKRYYAIGKYK